MYARPFVSVEIINIYGYVVVISIKVYLYNNICINIWLSNVIGNKKLLKCVLYSLFYLAI